MKAQLNEFSALLIIACPCDKCPQGHTVILTNSWLARREELQWGKWVTEQGCRGILCGSRMYNENLMWKWWRKICRERQDGTTGCCSHIRLIPSAAQDWALQLAALPAPVFIRLIKIVSSLTNTAQLFVVLMLSILNRPS